MGLCTLYLNDTRKDWRQEEKGMTEDEMVGWHHWFNGHEFEQAPGAGDGQGSLACCSPWGRKELDTTEQWNWTNKANLVHSCSNWFTPLWRKTTCQLSIQPMPVTSTTSDNTRERMESSATNSHLLPHDKIFFKWRRKITDLAKNSTVHWAQTQAHIWAQVTHQSARLS